LKIIKTEITETGITGVVTVTLGAGTSEFRDSCTHLKHRKNRKHHKPTILIIQKNSRNAEKCKKFFVIKKNQKECFVFQAFNPMTRNVHFNA
jgi:hypothetical protein